jgi:hypothetical protein
MPFLQRDQSRDSEEKTKPKDINDILSMLQMNGQTQNHPFVSKMEELPVA